MFEAFWNHTKITVIVLLIINRKFTKKIFPFTSFFPFFSDNFSYPKASFRFLSSSWSLLHRRRTKANDARSSERSLHAISLFSSNFGNNISLVRMSWKWTFIGRYKNIALKMWLSPGNKSGDSFDFYLQKSIARWEPSLIDF